ncbi:MAG: permease [Anaerolineae bacterium]|nr:permease [Anaerolineae bacterium]
MDATTIIMVALAVILTIVAYFRGGVHLAGLKLGAKTIWDNLLLLLASFAVAGLARVLIPRELISQWLGTQAGFKGILLGCVAGGIVPGSPYSVFPIIASFYEAGASIGTTVGFVTAYSLWSVVRLPLEVGIIGPKVALVRMISTLIFPPIAGLIAQLFFAKI